MRPEQQRGMGSVEPCPVACASAACARESAFQLWDFRAKTGILEVLEVDLEVLEVDILWPRWVARIGVTRSTQAWFLTADRQCTELPLLRLPRLVPEVVGCDPCVPRDLARVGCSELAERKGGVRSRSPLSAPLLPIGTFQRQRDEHAKEQSRWASPPCRPLRINVSMRHAPQLSEDDGLSFATCSTSSNNVRPWHCSQRARTAVLRVPLRWTFVKHACGKLQTLVSTSGTQT